MSNQIGVSPSAAESEAKTVNSDLDKGIEKNLVRALIPHGLDANGLAREVMGNEVQAQIHGQSLWTYRELREKNGKKELFEVCQTKSGEINRLVAVRSIKRSAMPRMCASTACLYISTRCSGRSESSAMIPTRPET